MKYPVILRIFFQTRGMQEGWALFPSASEETYNSWYKEVFSSEKIQYSAPEVDLNAEDEVEDKETNEVLNHV